MDKVDEVPSKEWLQNLWTNYNQSLLLNSKDSLWSRVSEMVNAFNGERSQMHRKTNTVDCLPVGVDCTLSPVLPPINNNHNEISSSTCAESSSSSSSSSVKRVVCSPDITPFRLPPSTTSTPEDVIVDSSTQSAAPSGQAETNIPTPPPPYQCTTCDKVFTNKSNLSSHIKSNCNKDSSDDPYQCNFCGKTFAVPARLTRHYRTHTGEKPYQCEFCHKSFSVKENLSVHKRIHTKERPYKCAICGRAFEHSGKLHRHMRIHTGERPHKCNFCNKTFIQSGQLVIHLRTHTGEKPYVCKCCGKGFTCSKQLKVHTRTHTGEKPYSCEICGKSFGYNHVLKLHQVAHYGEKVYKCTICKETFTSKKNMESHIKMSHAESNSQSNAVTTINKNVVANESELSSSASSTTSDKENKTDMETEEQMLIVCAETGEDSSSSDPLKVETSQNEGLATSDATTSYELYIPEDGPNSGQHESSYIYQNIPPTVVNFREEEFQHSPRFQSHSESYYTQLDPSSPSNNSSSPSSQSPIRLELSTESLMDHHRSSSSILYSDSYVEDTIRKTIASPIRYQHYPESSVNNRMVNIVRRTNTPPIATNYTNNERVEYPITAISKDYSILPPRKRSQMILESMERQKDRNYRQSSVIQYAKAS